MVRPRALLVVALLALLTSCGGGVQGGTSSRDGGGDGAGAQDVATQVVPAPHVPALRVVAPRTGGPWPVVLALHGVGGSGQDMLELASRVAESGAVVFVPTYSTDVSTQAGMQRTGDDLACAYRAARRDAPSYGGDVDLPVTVVGWSLGADLAVLGSLGPGTAPRSGPCAGQVRRPDAVVALSGCWYRFHDAPVTWFRDLSGWTNQDAVVHLVAGDDDATCPASQTDRMAGALRADGYDVSVTHLSGADHGAPVFHEEVGGHSRVASDDPAGDEVVRLVVATVGAGRQ